MSLRRASVPVTDLRERQTADALSRLVREIADRLLLSYGQPTVFIREDYIAGLGELVRVDPTDGPINIFLPSFRAEDIGKAITIANITASANAINVRAQVGLVNGGESIVVAKAYSVRQAVAAHAPTQLWLLTTVLDGSTGAQANLETASLESDTAISTTPPTYTDLLALSWTSGVAEKLLLLGNGWANSGAGVSDVYVRFDVDGSSSGATVVSGTYAHNCCAGWTIAVPAGAHTAKVQFGHTASSPTVQAGYSFSVMRLT